MQSRLSRLETFELFGELAEAKATQIAIMRCFLRPLTVQALDEEELCGWKVFTQIYTVDLTLLRFCWAILVLKIAFACRKLNRTDNCEQRKLPIISNWKTDNGFYISLGTFLPKLSAVFQCPACWGSHFS